MGTTTEDQRGVSGGWLQKKGAMMGTNAQTKR